MTAPALILLACPPPTPWRGVVFSLLGACTLSHTHLFATPRTLVRWTGSSVHGISQQEHWSGLPFLSPGESSQPRDQTRTGGFFTAEPLRKPCFQLETLKKGSPGDKIPLTPVKRVRGSAGNPKAGAGLQRVKLSSDFSGWQRQPQAAPCSPLPEA